MSKYAIGVDFGTLSARALVVEIGTGCELGVASMDYPHGVMDRRLPDGTPLKPDWALQHPQDYLDCLRFVIPEALRRAGISPDDVASLGIDFTACTVLPIDCDNRPLCFSDRFSGNPHAWVKLWKHHAAQDEARRMNEIAHARGETFLARYGDKVSHEWMFPKLWETLNRAPEVYEAADRFIDAGDWLVLLLTGVEARSSSIAGYKAFWRKGEGYPSPEFLSALAPRLANLADKLGSDIRPIGSRAGVITESGAALCGLNPGTPVAVANIDAHVSLPATGMTDPGSMVMIIGTSTCYIMTGMDERIVPGSCGVVADGAMPGMMGYEAGQTCVGDGFRWFVENCVPAAYISEAADRRIDVHQLLTEKADALRPGQSGLLALDWWNGNRSVLVDADLTGMILGMTLATRPEEIYRALIEATAYGARMIVETFEAHGVAIRSICACGGIAKKNPMMMQIYANVLNREIRVARSAQTPALGSAIFGAVAAGRAHGGYDTVAEAAAEMGGLDDRTYVPDPESAAVYDQLYREYAVLHDYFGRGENNVMKRLKQIMFSAGGRE